MTGHSSRRSRLDIAFGIVTDIIQDYVFSLRIEEQRPGRNEPYISEIKKKIDEMNEVRDSLLSLDKEVIERTIEKYEPVLQQLQSNPWMEKSMQLDIASDILGAIIGCHVRESLNKPLSGNETRPDAFA